MRKRQGNLTRMLKFHLRQKGAAVFLALLFVLGALAGSRLYLLCDEERVQLLNALFSLQQDSSFPQLFRTRCLTETAQLLLLFFCGFCAIGQPVSLFLLLYRGLGLGIMGSFLAQQGRAAFGYYALILLPQTLLFLLLQIAASKESIHFSMNFLRTLFAGNRGQSPGVRVYSLRFLLLLLLCVLCSLLSAFLQTHFAL